jgi:hypothetical protein
MLVGKFIYEVLVLLSHLTFYAGKQKSNVFMKGNRPVNVA